MERPTIKGPNKEVRAPLGESATFSVSVSGPAVYKSFLYRWQKREVGGKWENISGADSNTYTVDKVTSELNGAMFRCVVTGLTSSSEPIPFLQRRRDDDRRYAEGECGAGCRWT